MTERIPEEVDNISDPETKTSLLEVKYVYKKKKKKTEIVMVVQLQHTVCLSLVFWFLLEQINSL